MLILICIYLISDLYKILACVGTEEEQHPLGKEKEGGKELHRYVLYFRQGVQKMVLSTICSKYIILSSLWNIFVTERRVFDPWFLKDFFHWAWMRESCTYAKTRPLTEVSEGEKIPQAKHKLFLVKTYCSFSFPEIPFITKYSYLRLLKFHESI